MNVQDIAMLMNNDMLSYHRMDDGLRAHYLGFARLAIDGFRRRNY